MKGKSINRRKIPVQNKDKQAIQKQKNEQKLPERLSDEQNNKRLFLFAFLLIIITFAVFSPTFQNTYTNWDDGKYVAENPLIKPFDKNTVLEMFFSDKMYKRYWMGNYHPLTMLSLNINYALADKDDNGNALPLGMCFILSSFYLHCIYIFYMPKAKN